MKIKRIKILYFIFMYLPLIVTLVSLFFLPDKIPAHYGANNQVTRWGSKYEALLFPIFTLFMGYFILAIAKHSVKQESNSQNNSENNEKISITIGFFTIILFNVMTYFFLYAFFNKVEKFSELSIDIYKVIFAITGLLMIIIGNIMPKIRMNSLLGLRTPWSMKNESIWEKSQHFGGVSFIIMGIIILIISLFSTGLKCILATSFVFLVGLIIDVFYTYKESKKFIS